MQGFLHFHIPAWVRRLVTMFPPLIVIFIGLDPTRTLVISQVVLSFGLPFAIIPLIMFTRRRDIMGALVNRRITTIVVSVWQHSSSPSIFSCCTRSSSEASMFKHILVPLDGSKLSEAALDAASVLAQKLKSQVLLLHVIEQDAPAEVHKEHHLTDADEAKTYLITLPSEPFLAA